MNELNNLCRACLTPKESFNYFLFDTVSAETYAFCTSIEIKEDDKLSRAVCDTCFDRLTNYAEFKRLCLDSQKTLEIYHIKIKPEEHVNLENVSHEIADIKEHDYDFEANCETDNTDIKKEDYTEGFDEDLLPPELFLTDSEKVFHKKKKGKMRRNELQKEIAKFATRDKDKYTCDICGKAFKYGKRFEAHKSAHLIGITTGADCDLKLKCEKCDKSFMTLSGLRKHVESTHTLVRLASVSCVQCGRVCASKHSLRAHENSHGKRFGHAVCHVCGKRVSSQAILRVHLETHTADRERRHTCEHCGRKFFTQSILLSHIKRLHSGLRYICGECGYPFNDKYNLTKHLLIHEGKKLYKCDICNKSYGTNGTLVEHKRIHSGERPYACSFCPKRFLSSRRLKDHHKTHTGEKPHRCTICQQRFTQRGTLKRHMKVHDHERTNEPLKTTK